MSAKPRRQSPLSATVSRSTRNGTALPQKAPAAMAPAAQVSAPLAVQSAAPVAASLPMTLPAPPKPGKRKPVRDSFTMPPEDHALIGLIKARALKLGHPAKKSEVLRAGLKALAAMDDFALRAVLQAVPPLKTGRPAKADQEGGKADKPKGKAKAKSKAKAKDKAGIPAGSATS